MTLSFVSQATGMKREVHISCLLLRSVASLPGAALNSTVSCACVSLGGSHCISTVMCALFCPIPQFSSSSSFLRLDWREKQQRWHHRSFRGLRISALHVSRGGRDASYPLGLLPYYEIEGDTHSPSLMIITWRRVSDGKSPLVRAPSPPRLLFWACPLGQISVLL